jgi:hypothetical protein
LCPFVYRTTEHSSLKQTTSHLIFGRDVQIPLSDILIPARVTYNLDSDYATELKQGLDIAHTKAAEANKISFDKSHYAHNRKADETEIKIDDFIFMKNEKNGTSYKVGTKIFSEKEWTLASPQISQQCICGQGTHGQ